MAEKEKIGVEAVLETASFQKGIAQYMGGLGQATQASMAFAVTAGTLLADALKKVADIAAKAGQALADYTKEAIIGYSRDQELGLAAQFMGQSIGWSAGEISKLQAELEATGATSDIAEEALSKFAQHNLDAGQAVDLLTMAQNASIMSGKDVQSTYGDLIDAVTMLRSRSLKQYGITLDLTEANEAYAAILKKDASALTEDEQAQAFLNATLEKGVKLQGLYAEGMKLPAAQLRDLTSRILPEMMDAVGAPFQQAFATLVETVSKFALALTAAMSEGGKLYPIMVQLGAAASLLADGFRWAVETATNWGSALINNFSSGIVQAASDALNAAIQYVSDMLASWFSPGSPPRVAPQIDKWGAATIGEWLQGFQEADFSLLNEIQGPLQTALDLAFGSAGKAAAGEAFQHLSGDILQAIDIGEMSKQLFDEITVAGGAYGKQVALLTQYQIELNAAMQQGTVGSQDMVREYNALLRAGASQATLDAKMLEIRKAEQGTNKIGDLQKQVTLQSAIVAQQQKLAKAEGLSAGGVPTIGLPGAEKAPGGGGGAKPAGGGGPPKPPVNPFEGLKDSMATAIEDAKAKLVVELGVIWGNISTWFNTEVLPLVQGAWQKVSTFFAPVVENFQGGLGEMRKFWQQHKGEVEIIGSTMWEIAKKLFVFNLNVLGGVVQAGLLLISGSFKAFWQLVNGDAAASGKTMQTTFERMMDAITRSTSHSLEEVRQSWEFNLNTWAYLIDVGVEEIIRILGGFVGRTIKLFRDTDWVAVGRLLMDGIGQGIKDRVNAIAGEAIDAARYILDAIKGALGENSPSKLTRGFGVDVMRGLSEGMVRSTPQTATVAAQAARAIPMAMAPILASSTTNIAMNMGGVSIYNPMQLAQFESMLVRALKGAH